MKQIRVYVVCIALFCAYPALAVRPDISQSPDGSITIQFHDNDLMWTARALGMAFDVRVCVEDFGAVNPESKSVTPSSIENGGPVAKEDLPRFSGAFTAFSIEEMLDAVTKSTHYEWLQSNACYVIYPRKGSLLFEKVTVDIPACSLWDAVTAIFEARSTAKKKDEPIGFAYIASGPPKIGPSDVYVTPLHLVDTPLIDALCRAVEAVDDGTLFFWSLCGGWAHERRFGSLRTVEPLSAETK